VPRAIWKGAIAFGLVHIPVALYPASEESEFDFDWLDRRTLDPVGYKRINKRTGKEVTRENIVKGVRQKDGSYVVLSDEEVRKAYPKTTQTIEIEDFVAADEIPPVHMERTYYLEPGPNAGKVYALLREALASDKLMGIARIVMRAKEHLVAIEPVGAALQLHLLRWSVEIRPTTELKLPPSGRSQVGAGELKMARQLIGQMTSTWKPQKYTDQFSASIGKLIRARVKAGAAKTIAPLETAPAGKKDNVVDLTELLKKSLGQRRRA